ncbi:aldo/keto reductase [Candidatus Bathyarchaeota archaeon]|nr:aldo/keto reductase [Candidatus Bathyarchaeota archaeon]
MEYHEIAPGVEIPKIGLGTWGMGGKQIEDRKWDEETITAIRLAIDLGLTHIDTAEYYGAGHCEELVGEAIQSYDRDSLFVTTKVWRTNLHYDDLLKSMKASLHRLKQDYVDLYLIHWPNYQIPLKETMQALEECVTEGYTKYIGVSNFSSNLMQEAQSYLKDNYLVANQVEFSLLDQKPRTNLLPYLRETNRTLIAYSPLGKGILPKLEHKKLTEISTKYEKTKTQIALNWVVSQENVVAIPKSSNPIHLMEFMDSMNWRLKLEDIMELTSSFQ